jgi:acylglycerol lipase
VRTPSFRTEDHSLRSSDGESSLFVRHLSREETKIHFLIVHGALEHSGRHQYLENFLMESLPTAAVTTFDHVGHGRSGGARAYLTEFGTYVEDLKIVGEWGNSQVPSGAKHFICAHSLGGLITLTRFLDSSFGWPLPCDGLIFSSPCIKAKLLLGSSTEPLLDQLNKLSPRLQIPMIFTGADLTRDLARGNDFDTDPLIPRFITIRMMKEILDATHRIRGLSYYLKIPSLFLIAGNDALVDSESTKLFAHGIDKKLTTVVQYPLHHHELWNEIDRQEIFKTMKLWVERQLKENP